MANMVLYLNVNGTKFDFSTERAQNPNNDATIKIYNTLPLSLYAIDIYVVSDNYDAMEYLLSTNGNGTSRFSIIVDDTITYPIKTGVRGESFSNPITYVRSAIPAKPTTKLPTHKTVGQADFQFIQGNSDLLSAPTADYLKLAIRKSALTVEAELSHHLQNAVIVVEPSKFTELDPPYQYSIDDDAPPIATEINVRF